MFPLSTLRHSFAHVLAAAVNELYPGQVLFAIGPDIDHGFYYDLDFTGIDFREEMLADIEKKMRSLMHQKLRFDRFEVSVVKAIETLRSKGEVYKAEMAEELKAQGETMVSFYRMLSADGKEIFVDMCRGPHVDTTGDLPLEAFSLQKIAGAYWRGDAKNKMLTRIYGLAFETKAELVAHVTMLEEAKKRDHRELGKKLDLFHIDDKVGLGLPLWHPRGAMLWRKIEDFWYQEHVKNGYDLVRSPHIGNRTLWETSGHWGFYSESMYPALEAGQTLKDAQQDKKAEVTESYLLKPMNCPFHVQIYKHHPHSYREFPMRWAECGTVYRFEKK
jgi:threonyl-tRNA synthetase